MTGHVAVLPGMPDEPPLSGLAPAPVQLARLLDALLMLEVERKARVADLAHRVGVKPAVLRKLLSSYMVAAADAVGTSAQVTITFGTSARPLSASPDDEAEQATADVVYLSRSTGGSHVLDDVGRRPVLVEDVARGLLAVRAVLEAGVLDDRQRRLVDGLVEKLSTALGATVTAPFDAVADRLRAAVRARQRVRFRYVDPWTGAQTWPEVEPYDVRRHRTRLFLDAGAEPQRGFQSFDVSGIAELEVEGCSTFDPPLHPPASERAAPFDVVVEAPTGSAGEGRLADGWGARVAGVPRDGRIHLRFALDRLHAETRLGVLLLQLGPGCAVVSPLHLVDAAVPVARRLLDTLPPADVTAR